MDPIFAALLGLIAGVLIAAGIFLLTRRRRTCDIELIERFQSLDRAQEREERLLREEAARSREEAQSAAKAQREELNAALQNLGESNLSRSQRSAPC